MFWFWSFHTHCNCPYGTCTSPIIHLICPSKFCITFAFHFCWVSQPSQEKLKTMLMQNFGRQIRCIMGDVQVAYEEELIKHTFVKELWISDTLTSKSALIPWLCLSWVFFFSFRNSIPVFGYQINTLTRVSSNKSNATSSVSSGIQTPRSAGLKKRDALFVFPHELLTCLRILRRLNKRVAE